MVSYVNFYSWSNSVFDNLMNVLEYFASCLSNKIITDSFDFENNLLSDVESIWVAKEKENEHMSQALENASRHFDENDVLTVHTIESIYGQESSFGKNRRTRGMEGAAGDFHFEKKTAEQYGLHVSKENDERFDVDNASDAAARYLKDLDSTFGKDTVVDEGLKSIGVKDSRERKNFVLAAYNGGPSRIAKSQNQALQGKADPTKWEKVKDFLMLGGATFEKAKQISDYVRKVLGFELEFDEKSELDEELKDKEPKPLGEDGKIGKWITKDGNRIYI